MTANRPRPVALITGAAQGIGLLSAQALAATHRVLLLDLNAAKLAAAVTSCGPDALGFCCDITQQGQVTAAVADAVRQAGAIDVLVSNAGIGTGCTLRHMDPDVLAAQINVNLIGNWRIIHACLPHLIARRGYVLAVASAAAFVPAPVLGGYCASKAALEMLLETLRIEVAHLGVDVGVAYPAFHDTELVRLAEQSASDFLLLRSSQPWPMNKVFPAERAAAAIAKAVRQRRRRVFAPGWIVWLSRLRMLLRTHTGMRAARQIAPAIDALSAARVAEQGGFAAAMVDTPAMRAGAASVGRVLDKPASH